MKTIATLAAATWTFFLYLDHRQDGRITETLKYVERLAKDETAKTRYKLDGYWSSLEGIGTYFSKNDVDLRNHAVNRVRDKGLEVELVTMFEFYTQVALCTRKNICDVDTACAYFGDSVNNFYEMYFPLIEVWGLASRADNLSEIREFRNACVEDTSWKRVFRFVF